MAMQMIPVRFIQYPPFYIRIKPNKEIVEQWTSELKEGGKIREPIELWVPTDPKALEKGKRYEIVDGRKRYDACIAARVKEIPAEVKTFKDDKEAFARQYQSAQDGGEFLSKKQRNHYVKIMRDTFKLKLAEIAKLTKISDSQVSRISRGVSASPKPRAKPSKKRFTVKGYLEEVRFLGVQFHNYRESIEKYASDKGAELAAFFKALEKVLPLLAEEEPAEA